MKKYIVEVDRRALDWCIEELTEDGDFNPTG